MKKAFWILVILPFILSGVYGAQFSISPEEGSVATNCIEDFFVNLDMAPGDEMTTVDIVLESNMKFVKFENSDIFGYSVPPREEGNIVKLLLFSSNGEKISEGGKVGTLYYDTSNVEGEPYIKYVFYGVGETIDTNVNIAGADILTNVRGGTFTLSDAKNCEILPLSINSSTGDLDSFIDEFNSDHQMERFYLFINKYGRYILGSFLILVIVAVLTIHRITKKG